MTCRSILVALALMTVFAALAQAAPTVCNAECTPSSCRTQSCTDPESGSTITCQAWGTYNVSDWDCDGVGSGDNCPSVANSSQADCDGDGSGDACDSENATYQPTNDASVCHIDAHSSLLPFGHWDFDVEADIRWEDTSSCNAPDELRTQVIDVETCWSDLPFLLPPKFDCCWIEIGSRNLCTAYLDNDQCTGS